jgi:hypothetical protein
MPEKTPLSVRDQEHLVRVFGHGGIAPPHRWRESIICNEFRSLMETIFGTLPDSRERSLALTNLETAYLYAKEALERNQPPVEAAS